MKAIRSPYRSCGSSNVVTLKLYVVFVYLFLLGSTTSHQPSSSLVVHSAPILPSYPSTSSSSSVNSPPEFTTVTPSLRKLEYRKRDDSVIIYLADGNPNRITDLIHSLQNLDTYFNQRYDYPILIFYSIDEDNDNNNKVPVISPDQQMYLQSQTLSALTFVPIHLSSYAGSSASVAGSFVQQAPSILHGRFTIGYRHMCNFFAGPIAFEKALQPYRYYWRFDTDSFLASPIPYDIFMRMAQNSYKFGWATKQCDWPTVTKGLYDIAYDTFNTPGQPLVNKLENDMKDSTCPKGTDTDTPYNSRIYYNNFEIVDLEFLRSPAYQAFYYRIAELGGIYTHRWGDAPIRTLAVRALLPSSAIHHFNDISYWHQNLYGPLATYAIIGGIFSSILLISGILYCIYLRSKSSANFSRTSNMSSNGSTEDERKPLGWWLFLTKFSFENMVLLPSVGLYIRSLLRNPSSSSSSDKVTWLSRIRFILFLVIQNTIESMFCLRFRWLSFLVGRTRTMITGKTKNNFSSSSITRPKGIPFSSSFIGNPTYRNFSCIEIKNRSFLYFGIGIVTLLWFNSRSRLTLWPEQTYRLSTSFEDPVSSTASFSLDYLRCRSDDLDCLLATRANKQKEIVVTAVSEGALPFLTNLIQSWRKVNLHNYIVFALDAPSAEFLHQRNIPTYWDPAPLSSYTSCRWQDQASQAYEKAFTKSSTGSMKSPKMVSSPFVPCTADERTKENNMDPSLASGLSEVMDSSKGNFKYNSAGFVTVTHRKNEVVLEVLKRGYVSFFTDADTVWLRNVLNDPITRDEGLSQPCNSLRLGDTINFVGDYPTHIQNRKDCGTSSSVTPYPFDVKGMYGDSGGMDTGFWYMRNTTASINHMRAVVNFQRHNPSALTMNDQDTYNHLLRPWHSSHLVNTHSFGTKTTDATLPTSIEGFGPAHLKVALFHPLFAPTGCRLSRAIDDQFAFAVGHANCREGYFRKVLLLAWYGLWSIRYYDDKLVYRFIFTFFLWLMLRRLMLIFFGPSYGSNRDHTMEDETTEETMEESQISSGTKHASPKREYHTSIDIEQGTNQDIHIRYRENE